MNRYKGVTDKFTKALRKKGETMASFARKHGFEYQKFRNFIAGEFKIYHSYHEEYIDAVREATGIDISIERSGLKTIPRSKGDIKFDIMHKSMRDEFRIALLKKDMSMAHFLRKYGFSYAQFRRFIDGFSMKHHPIHDMFAKAIKAETGIDVLKERGFYDGKVEPQDIQEKKAIMEHIRLIGEQTPEAPSIVAYPNDVEDFLVDVAEKKIKEIKLTPTREDESHEFQDVKMQVGRWSVVVDSSTTLLHATSFQDEVKFKISVSNPHDPSETFDVIYNTLADSIKIIYHIDFICFKKDRNGVMIAPSCQYVPSRDGEYYMVVTPEIRVAVNEDEKRLEIKATSKHQEADAFGGDEWRDDQPEV